MAKEFTDSEMDNLLAQESLIVIDFGQNGVVHARSCRQ